MYRVNVVADFESAEEAVRGYNDMSEAVGKNNGDEQLYDIEWYGETPEEEEPKPTAGMWDALFNLDVGMGRVTAWTELTEADGLDREEAVWVIEELDRRMKAPYLDPNDGAERVWFTGWIPEVDDPRHR